MTTVPPSRPKHVVDVDAYAVPDFLAQRIHDVHGHDLECATALIREAKRMLYLCAVSGEAVAPSEFVDHAWHEMLMFTRWYKQFSQYIGTFVHHDPTPPEEKRAMRQHLASSDVPAGKREVPTYTTTKQHYRACFGEDPDPRWWP